MISVRRTAAVGAAGALAVGIAMSGVGITSAGAADYPPVTPTPTPVNPGKIKCKAKAVNAKDRIRVTVNATGDAAKFKNFTFKIQKYLPDANAWQINNIAYNISVGEPVAVDRERGRYRAKCFGPENRAPLSNRVRLLK